MKRQLLFAMILFTASLVAQTKTPAYLSGSDSLSSFAPQEKYVKFGIVDSSDTFTDTLRVYVKMNNGTYQLIGCQNLLTGDIETVLIPGDGETARYLVNEPFPISVLIQRTNIDDRERRTSVWWSSSGSY